MADRLKVLISAYACSPTSGSEPGVGWGIVTALSKHHDLWVLTEKDEFEAEVRRELARRPDLARHARFFFLPKSRHRLLRRMWPPSYYWFYRRWHRDAYALARRLHAEVGFDVVHQLGMMGFREPGYLWKLDAPFVWGPIAGMNLVPWRFLPALGLEGAAFHTCRNLVNMAHMRLLRRPRLAARRSNGSLLVSMEEMLPAVRRFLAREGRVLVPQAPLGQPVTSGPVREAGEPLRLAWSGLHVSRKALPLLLGAMASLPPGVDATVDILGQGPMTARWQRMAARLGVAERCRWHGWLPRAEAVALVGRAHVFVFTSVSDCVANVVLEAMALGIPLVFLNHCGCPDVLTPDCGVPIPVTSPDRAKRAIAAAITELWEDEPARQRRGRAAAERAARFGWDAKAECLCGVYEAAVTGRKEGSRG